jgi:hypothetical protein
LHDPDHLSNNHKKKEEIIMCHPDEDYEYREKWGRLGIEVEMLLLDIIHCAVERLNHAYPVDTGWRFEV